MRPILIIPGCGNSGPGHWQSLWEANLRDARRVEMPNWEFPHRADWVEDEVPPPPEYRLRGLVDIEMPRTSNIRMGLVPDSLRLNVETGIVRYVVVAQGPSAVNASYEGIRCATGEYRVYARQVQGGDWIPTRDSSWKPMRGAGGVQVVHPYQLARNGLCIGTAMRLNAAEMLRELKTGNRSLYY